MKKILFLDSLSYNSTIRVGSHRYAELFKNCGYEVFSISDYVNMYKLFRNNRDDIEAIANWRKGVQVSKNGVLHYTPFCLLPYLNLPFLDSLMIARNCLRFTLPDLKHILMRAGFIDVDAVFINNLKLVSALNFIRPRLKILRISDRVDAFPNTPKTIIGLCNQIAKNSDLVFCTSQILADELRLFNSRTFYLPNGVSADFITQPNTENTQPPEYKGLPRPIIIYVGAVSDWFDYNTFEYGLKSLQNCSFVVIGDIAGVNFNQNRIRIDKMIKTYNNFSYLGSRSHNLLKPYLIGASAGIIPFVINSLTDQINPVKLFEYCACGLPVIASDMSEVRQYENYVFRYRTKEEYVASIVSALNQKDQRQNQLKQFAEQNTWENRFNFLLSKMNS